MSDKDRDLPDWIKSRIDEVNYSRDLTQRRVAEEFVYGDRPFYNKAKMHARVGNSVSPDTVYARLEELDERDVLNRETVNNGDIFWLNEEDSRWPIPTDVKVTPIEPEDSEITLSEWREKFFVKAAAVSVALAVIGTAVTLVGTFETTGAYPLPLDASTVIAWGLVSGIFSYIGLLIAGVLWVFDVDELPPALQGD